MTHLNASDPVPTPGGELEGKTEFNLFRRESTKRRFQDDLFEWFEHHQRALPWRQHRTSYRVWVAELMLQQTRAQQTITYFERFIERFPSVQELAEADQSAVLKAWEGLGYYARARNAHRAAQIIQSDYGGQFPRSYDALIRLPGIGPYTAAAILSIAFNKPYAVLDGNVKRVLSRVLAQGTPVDTSEGARQLQEAANALMPTEQPQAFNEALMELGALVCLPRKPLCLYCPLREHCEARALGNMEDFPRKKPRKAVPHVQVAAGLVYSSKQGLLIAQRPSDRMLGGLWEFPGGKCETGETLAECLKRELYEELRMYCEIGPWFTTVHHAYSHFTMELHVFWARIRQGRPRAYGCADYRWIRPGDWSAYAFPKADLKVIQTLDAEIRTKGVGAFPWGSPLKAHYTSPDS